MWYFRKIYDYISFVWTNYIINGHILWKIILASTGDGTHKNEITRPWHSFDGLGVFIPKIANITKNELTRPRHSTC